MIHGVGCAAMEDEIGKFGDVRGIFVIDLVPTPRGRPVGTIPYGGIEGHRLGGEPTTHGLVPHHLSNRNIVDIKSAHQKGEKAIVSSDHGFW